MIQKLVIKPTGPHFGNQVYPSSIQLGLWNVWCSILLALIPFCDCAEVEHVLNINTWKTKSFFLFLSLSANFLAMRFNGIRLRSYVFNNSWKRYF